MTDNDFRQTLPPDKINPYGQHYRAVQRLLRNAVQNDIFMYLLDEHLCLLRKGIASPAIVTTTSIIAEGAGVNRGVVAANIKKLEELGLVLKQGKTYYVCVDYLDSIVTLFNSMPTLEEKQKVGTAFRANDRQRLSRLGLKSTTNGNEHLLNLRGGILSTCRQKCSDVDKMMDTEMSTSNQNCSDVDKIVDVKMSTSNQNCSDVDKIRTSNPILSTSEQKCLDVDKTAHISTKMFTFEHYCSNIRTVFPTKSDFIGSFMGVLSTSEQNDELIEIADLIFSPTVSESGGSDLEKMSTCEHFILSTCRHLCSHLSNRNNKEKNKKKSGNERSEARVEDRGMGEGGSLSFEEPEELPDNFSLDRDFLEPEEFYEAEEETEEELPDDSEEPCMRLDETIALRKLAEDVEAKRRQRNLPKFTVDEVEEIIADIHNCTDRQDKIFINRLWACVDEYYEGLFDDGYMEDLEDYTDFNPEGELVPVRVVNCWIEQSMEETARLIEDHRIDADDEELDITVQEFEPQDIKVTFAWERVTSMRNEHFYKISKGAFYDVKGGELPAIRKQTGRRCVTEEDRALRKDDLEYCQKICLLDDEGRSDELTPIEKAVAAFEKKYLRLDEVTMEASMPDDSQLFYGEVDKIKLAMVQLGLKIDDLIEICFKSQPIHQSRMLLTPRMFSADKIRRFNMKRKLKSVVDSVSLSDFLDFDGASGGEDGED